jgi:hypothetical protein
MAQDYHISKQVNYIIVQRIQILVQFPHVFANYVNLRVIRFRNYIYMTLRLYFPEGVGGGMQEYIL